MSEVLPAQFVGALYEVEGGPSLSDLPDGGRALGRPQVHPDALFDWARFADTRPQLNETWDDYLDSLLRAIYAALSAQRTPVQIAMWWHLGHPCVETDADWDQEYAARFTAALAKRGV